MVEAKKQLFWNDSSLPESKYSLKLVDVYEQMNKLVNLDVIDLSHFTMSVWCKFQSASSPYASLIGMVSDPLHPNANGCSITGGVEGSGNKFGVVADGVMWWNTSAAVPDTAWHYVAVVLSDGKADFYLDNAKMSTESFTPRPGSSFMLGGGRDYQKASVNVARGCWWNRSLTDTEIHDDFQAGQMPPSSDGLICYCPIDDMTTLTDKVSGENFTIVAGTTIVDESPWTAMT